MRIKQNIHGWKVKSWGYELEEQYKDTYDDWYIKNVKNGIIV